MDSGKRTISSTATTIGIEPPTANIDCQPYFRISAATVHPANADPNEKPQNMTMTAEFRDRFGMYSDVSAIALGMAPPMPNPVKTRNPMSCDAVVAVVVSSDPRPKASAHITST